MILALPLPNGLKTPWVAVAPFATRHVSDEGVAAAAQLLGLREHLAEWICSQPAWPAHALQRLGREVLRHMGEQRRGRSLMSEVEKVSSCLANSYEEISLLHSISQNFRLSRTDEELGVLALEWLRDCVPARRRGPALFACHEKRGSNV